MTEQGARLCWWALTVGSLEFVAIICGVWFRHKVLSQPVWEPEEWK